MSWTPRDKNVNVLHQNTVDWPDRGYGFIPPALPGSTPLNRHELALSIARNIAKSTLRPTVLNVLVRNAWKLLDVVIDRNAVDLNSLSDIDHFGDQALNNFAHDMAVGVAGVLMQRQSFVWLAHTKEMLPQAARPDYVWYHRSAPGLAVLSEVKGMAGSSMPFGTLMTRTRNAFTKQVDPWKLDYTLAGDPIVGGYAIGVRVAPVSPAGVVAIRSVPIQSGPTAAATGAGGQGLSLGAARAHYGAAVALLGLGGMARRIVGLSVEDRPLVRLDVVGFDGQRFVVRSGDRAPTLIGMEFKAFSFAAELEQRVRYDAAGSGRRLEPPVYNIGRFETIDGSADLLSLAPDGMALLRRPSDFGRMGSIVWSPHSRESWWDRY